MTFMFTVKALLPAPGHLPGSQGRRAPGTLRSLPKPEGVDATQTGSSLNPACIPSSSCPPPALVKEVLSNVQRLTFYGFLVALSKHHGISQALGKPELAVATASCGHTVQSPRGTGLHWPTGPRRRGITTSALTSQGQTLRPRKPGYAQHKTVPSQTSRTPMGRDGLPCPQPCPNMKTPPYSPSPENPQFYLGRGLADMLFTQEHWMITYHGQRCVWGGLFPVRKRI